MTDPVFTTRAEMQAWTKARAQAVPHTFLAAADRSKCLADIKRVTLAHSHLMEEADDAVSE